MVFPPPQYVREPTDETAAAPVPVKGTTPFSVVGEGGDSQTAGAKGKRKGKGAPSLKVVK
jgi:hypothetical protein